MSIARSVLSAVGLTFFALAAISCLHPRIRHPLSSVLQKTTASSSRASQFRGVHPNSSYPHLAVLVQGPASGFKRWRRLLQTVQGSSSIRLHFVFASYDRRVKASKGDGHTFTSETAYIPHSTWDQGREALARKAWCAQERLGRNFSYWLFSDDDVEVKCGGKGCWRELFRFLVRKAGPLKVPVVPLRSHRPGWRGRPGAYLATNNFDPCFNAVHSDYVPYVLPYAFARGESWWTSASVQKNLFSSCFPFLAIEKNKFRAENQEHRSYARGRDWRVINDTTVSNYGHYVGAIDLKGERQVRHEMDAWQFKDWHEVVRHVRRMRETKRNCDRLADRFLNWLYRGSMPDKTAICAPEPYLQAPP